MKRFAFDAAFVERTAKKLDAEIEKLVNQLPADSTDFKKLEAIQRLINCRNSVIPFTVIDYSNSLSVFGSSVEGLAMEAITGASKKS